MATEPVAFSFYHINAEIHTTPAVLAWHRSSAWQRPWWMLLLLQWTPLWLQLTIAMDVLWLQPTIAMDVLWLQLSTKAGSSLRRIFLAR